MSTICINNLKVYAYHGVFEVERKVGQWYIVNLEVDVEFTEAAIKDTIEGTVDYSKLSDMIRDEMKTKSKLIENVAHRIATRLLREFPQVESGTLSLAKQNPPIQGEMESFEVVIEL
ncbi:MAG: dihydroneopterin aldolase [Flavobacteriales bacterium]|jgi:7,8-dihydroneopterin aldolase/epimerase/oxygenase|nr:dihydroneopterin aldolase [Flavobacteriales bacterium]|tara:strand:- start:41 stop:391 length:351 start_codon:yes stop_codon:yes gene_type:complete